VIESELQLTVVVPSAPSPELDRVMRIAAEIGLRLVPLHPGTGDPDLRRFFTAPVSDLASGEEAAERFRSVAGVHAYVKPPPELA
jgi:hypothetical protein